MSRSSSDPDTPGWPVTLREVLHTGRSVVWEWDVPSGSVTSASTIEVFIRSPNEGDLTDW